MPSAIVPGMTTYAFDPSTRHLVASVAGGAGALAHTVARLHPRTGDGLGRRLAHQLTLLSTEAWISYTDADRAGPVPQAAALAAIRGPDRSGGWVDPDWVVQRSYEVGRTLVEIGSAGVRRAVLDDVAAELASIDRALLGDLAGRAVQAVTLTRLDASPVQIAAADRMLHEQPLGGEDLLTDVEPTAAHWAAAAVEVAMRASGRAEPRDVLDPREAVEPFDVVASCLVVSRVAAGEPPLQAVQRLIRPAMEVARGFVPEPEDCDVPGLVVLDPLRPARHLLDRLLMALRTCAVVYGGRRSDFESAVRDEAGRAASRLFGAAVGA